MQVAALLLAGFLAAQAVPPSTDGKSAAESKPTPQPDRISYKGNFTPKEHRASIPYELVNGYVLFKIKVAGREVWALLDTGATRSIVDTGLAKAAGLSVTPAVGTIRTATGVAVPKLRVSNVSLSIDKQLDLQAEALGGMDLTTVSQTIGRKVEFVLGADLIAATTLRLDPGQKTFDLFPPGAFRPPPNFPFVPLTYDQKTIRLEIRVDEQPVQVTLDTGSSVPLSLEPQAWTRLAPAGAKLRPGTTVGADGQVHIADYGVVSSIRIGPVRSSDVRTKVAPLFADADGSIGIPALSRFFLVIDVRSGKLWLAPRLSAAPAATAAPVP